MVKEEQQELLDKLRQGGETTFKKVYDDNRVKFLHFAKKYGLSKEECLDIYQDAYITFYQNIISGKLKELSSALSTYLFGIGKFLIMNSLEKNKRTVRSEYAISIARDEDAKIENIDWEESLTREQELLKKYFETLGEQCQKLLSMFYYRGLSIKEIIIQGGYNNANVVKSQKSRCLKTLRERILKPRQP